MPLQRRDVVEAGAACVAGMIVAKASAQNQTLAQQALPIASAEGYDRIVSEIAQLEQRVALADLSQFTPRPPGTTGSR